MVVNGGRVVVIYGTWIFCVVLLLHCLHSTCRGVFVCGAAAVVDSWMPVMVARYSSVVGNATWRFSVVVKKVKTTRMQSNEGWDRVEFI